MSLLRLGFDGESGLGEEPVDERGPTLAALEPVPDDGDVLAARFPGRSPRSPRPFGGVEAGGVGGQPDHRQPVAVRSVNARITALT